MPTQDTPLLGLALPVQGELTGTWGNTVNDSITSLVDSAVAGTTTLSTDADVTLTTTVLAANQARQSILLCTGARTTLKTIIAPARSKAYIVINATTGGFGVKVVGVGPTTPGVTIPNGEKALIAWNGSDFVMVSSSVIDLTSEVTGTLPIANGGTGTTSTTFANLTTNVTGTLPIANGGTGTTSTTFANLTTNVTGTLPIANGGTGTTSTTFANLTTNVTGVLPAANGGTAQSTYTTGDIVYASATNTLSKRAVGSAGQVLTVTAGVPTWSDAATGLPSQTGNAGKFLTTNGTSASWANTGAAAGGGIYVNNDVISQDYTISTGQNGFSVGPMTISSGYAVTVSSGQRWVIL
jgi:hypothetical protein